MKPVLIVGGGIAGLTVAKILSDNGVASTIIEQSDRLGGNARNWACMATERCMRCFCCVAEDLVEEVSASSLITVRTGWEPSSVSFTDGSNGTVGLKDFSTGEEIVTEASALVFAVGFEPYDPSEKVLLGYGLLEGVYTLPEVNSFLRRDDLSPFTRGADGLNIAFIQCVGSRDQATGADYCSQYCCKAALKTALKLIHECGDPTVTIFYIDLQVAGKYAGDLFEESERKNVRLRQGIPGEIIQGENGLLEVTVECEGRNTKETFDRIILSVGQRFPRFGSSFIPQNSFGFMQSKSILDDSRTNTPGIYVAGTCTGPKDIEQTLEHAGRTAAEILADLQGGGSGYHE